MSKDAQQESVEKSLDEEIMEALQALEGEDDADAPDTEEDSQDDGEGEEGQGSDGDEGESSEPEEDEQDGEEGGEEEGEEDAGSQEEVSSLEPPQHWSREDRETFSSVPREAQEFLLKRHKDMEADYTRKTQEVAHTRRQFDEQQQILAPIAEDLAMLGADSNAFMRQQVAWAQAFKADPNSAITRLAEAYGLDIAQVAQSQQDVDPQVQSLQSEIAAMKAQQQQSLQTQQQTEQNRLLQEIQDFAEDKDDSGNLKHPHFEEIKAEMGQVIQAGMATGLDDAYAKVAAMKGLQATEPQRSITEAKSKPADQKAKVRRAKRAATGVKTSGTKNKPVSEDMSLEDEIAALVNKT